MRTGGLIDGLFHRRILHRWRRLALGVDKLNLSSLRQLRARAREFRRSLNKVIHVAEGRLTLTAMG